MATVTLDSTAYTVSAVSVEIEDLTRQRRAYSGAILTARPTRATVKRWSITTDLLTRASAQTLMTALIAPGTVSLDGDVADNAATVCVVDGGVSSTEIYSDLVFVSFVLVEV